MDKKQQIEVDAQALGEGLAYHSLALVLESIEIWFKCLDISENIYARGTVVTADTGLGGNSYTSECNAVSETTILAC